MNSCGCCERAVLGIFLFLFLAATGVGQAYAKDVYVHGYYRSNGTYVHPYVRSSPDSSRANNYGPSRSSSERMNPRSRDNDNDGIPNYLDNDDNNNGIPDNSDPNQYGR